MSGMCNEESEEESMKNKTPKVDPYYKRISRDFIDTLFDKGYFSEKIKREEMRQLDDYLGFLFESRCDMAIRTDRILRKI